MKMPEFISKIPNVTVPVINVQTNPLDLLLVGLGLRMALLAHSNPEFAKLLEGKDFIFQIATEDGEARHFTMRDGRVSQSSGAAEKPDFTLKFKDAETAFSTLVKGDPTAFMTGMQNGTVKMEGDFSVLMWFNQAAKLLVPKMPPVVTDNVRRVKGLLGKRKKTASDQAE